MLPADIVSEPWEQAADRKVKASGLFRASDLPCGQRIADGLAALPACARMALAILPD